MPRDFAELSTRLIPHADGFWGSRSIATASSCSSPITPWPSTPTSTSAFEPTGISSQDRTRTVTAGDIHKRPPPDHLAGKTTPLKVEKDGLRFLIDVTGPVSPGLFQKFKRLAV